VPTPTAEPTAMPTHTAVPTVAPSATPAPTATPKAAVGPAQVLLEDNFGDPNSGWDSGKDTDAEWGYRNGVYRIAIWTQDMFVWANTSQRHDWDNLVIIVEAQRTEGPVDNEYGVLVRYVDRGNFYFFGVSSDGMYHVQMMRNDEWNDLVEWTPSDAVRQNEGTNVLRVECQGQNMRFFVNDKLLTMVQDDNFPSGNVGFGASTPVEETGVVVHFDNLLVRALPES